LKIAKPFVFVRHPESEGNILSADERALLSTPNHKFSCTQNGLEQARFVAEYINDLREPLYPHWMNSFFQSTFKRSQEGVDILLKNLKSDIQFDFEPAEITPITDSRLDEKWDGIFHELTKAEIEGRYPEQIRLRKRSGYYHYRAPGGENCPDVEMRITSFVAEHLATPFGHAGYVCIVGHGRWFQIFQKLIHNLSVDEFLEHKKTVSNDNCAVTIYTLDNMGEGLESIPQSVVPWKGKIEASSSDYA